MNRRRLALLALLIGTTGLAPLTAQGAKLRKWLKDDAADFWIYDDLKAGQAQAKKTGKPLLVSFRCVP